MKRVLRRFFAGLLVFSVIASGCASTITVLPKDVPIGNTSDGGKWVMRKFITLVSGNGAPGLTCDETIFIKVDKDNFVQDIRFEASHRKECFGEESLRNVLVGRVVPAVITGGAIAGGLAVMKAAKTTVTQQGGDVVQGQSNFVINEQIQNQSQLLAPLP